MKTYEWEDDKTGNYIGIGNIPFKKKIALYTGNRLSEQITVASYFFTEKDARDFALFFDQITNYTRIGSL